MKFNKNENDNEIEFLTKKLGIQPNLKLGQVFLKDEDIAKLQVEYANLLNSDTVLEIGPGFGILTRNLAKQAGSVIAIEYDKKLFNYLTSQMPKNVELILGDALKVEFPRFNKVVSNIPYQISSSLIFKLTKYKFKLAILMLQAEFANRLLAKEKSKTNKTKSYRNYSRLSVMASYYYDIDFLGHVSRTSFSPIPIVDSAIIKLTPKLKPLRPINEKLFFNLVKIVFSNRRKMIKNSLKKHFLILDPKSKTMSKEEISKIINHLPYLKLRPEELSLKNYIHLSDNLDKLISN
jgi:16S rRNA (adenine1518-N6/adenine1519-N6)-dimethyltransferase